MKKLLFAFAVLFSTALISCKSANESTDSTTDSIAVTTDSIVVDSIVVDSIL